MLTDGRSDGRTDGRTDARQNVMTKAHLQNEGELKIKTDFLDKCTDGCLN